MSLENIGNVALNDEQQDQITSQWADVYEDAYKTLTISGFEEVTTPPAIPPLDITPNDYANLEGENYTHHMSHVDYWFVRAKEQLGWVEAELICREGEYKDVTRTIKNQLREQSKGIAKKTDRPTETEIKEQAESYPYPRQLEQRITYLRGVEVVLKRKLDGYERLASGLSRQVTLRGQEIDLGGRSDRRGHPGRFQSL